MGRNKNLLFSRTIHFGTGRIVETLVSTLKVDESQAERMLLQTGINHAGGTPTNLENVAEIGRMNEMSLPAGLFEICGRDLGQVSSEVRRSFNYFGGLPSGERIERAMLIGSVLPTHLDRYLTHELGIPVTLGKAFSVVSDTARSEDMAECAFVLAAGLALREEIA